MFEAILAVVGLIGTIAELTRRDRARYRRGNTVRKCRIHKRGGMWFFRIGRLGGSLYIRRAH